MFTNAPYDHRPCPNAHMIALHQNCLVFGPSHPINFDIEDKRKSEVWPEWYKQAPLTERNILAAFKSDLPWQDKLRLIELYQTRQQQKFLLGRALAHKNACVRVDPNGSPHMTVYEEHAVTVPPTHPTLLAVYNHTHNASLCVPSTIRTERQFFQEVKSILKKIPFSQQLIATEFLYEMKMAACLFDMRVGKTLPAIGTGKLRYQAGDVEALFVVAPAPILESIWFDELVSEGFEPLILNAGIEQDATALAQWRFGADLKDRPRYNAFIISYESLSNRLELIAKYLDVSRLFIIVDEVSKCKNPTAVRTDSLLKLTYSAKYVVPLSGTPMENGPQDFWTCAYIIDRGVRFCSTFSGFCAKWLVQLRNGRWAVNEAKRLEFELLLQSIGLRWVRSEADQFSGKDSTMRWILTAPNEEQIKATDDAIQGFVETHSGDVANINAHILTLMGYLREICCGYNKVKLEESGPYSRFRFTYDPKTLWLEAFLEGNPGVPVVVYIEFVEHGTMICEMLDRIKVSYVNLSDAQPGSERRFQNGDVRVCIANPKSVYGMTMNRVPAVKAGLGSYPVIIYMAPTWELGAFQQSLARCQGTDPVSQKSINTPIYMLATAGSIESEKIIPALKKKVKVQETLLKDHERKGFASFTDELRIDPDRANSDDVFDAREMSARLMLRISPEVRCTHKRIDKQLAAAGINTNINVDVSDAIVSTYSDWQYKQYHMVKSALYLKEKYDERGYARSKNVKHTHEQPEWEGSDT